MKIEIKQLNSENLGDYIVYLQEALSTEPDPDNLLVDSVDEKQLNNALNDEMLNSKKILLAYIDGKAVGRIEYHFYMCFGDSHKMCYVDWVYTLKDFRGKGVAKQLFAELEKDCKENNINQFYLIRATNEYAQIFYDKFSDVTNKQATILRKAIK